MTKIGKIIVGLLVAIYVLVAMFLTTCLLKYNDYKITEFGNKSLIIVSDDILEEEYKKGSLLVVEKKEENIKKGDRIVFYNTYENQVSVAISEVLSKEQVNEKENTYTITGDYDISSEYIIGSTKDIKVIPVLGTILAILESRVGFLIFIIFPITLAFLYQIYALVIEINNERKTAINEKKNKNEKSTEEEK